MSASAISFGGCVRFMMTVYVTVFNIIAAAFKTFPENWKEKQAKIYEKNRAEKKNFYWFSALFREKMAKISTFFEIFWRKFNADKCDG